MTVEDPFASPADIPSEHPSAASFRGRLILIEPTKLELNLPKKDNSGRTEDKMTATVTVVDGQGPVQLMPQQVPSGIWVDGPVYEGVWFSQERVVLAVCPKRVMTPGRMVLARLDTYKPGQPAKQGNPWGLIPATDEERQVARDFLANRPKPEEVDPFAPKNGAPF